MQELTLRLDLERLRLDLEWLGLKEERLGLGLERLSLDLEKLGLAPMLAARWCAQFEALLLELVLPFSVQELTLLCSGGTSFFFGVICEPSGSTLLCAPFPSASVGCG